MERIVKQIRKIKIEVPGYYVDDGQGFGGSMAKGIVYYDGLYTNTQDIEQKINDAKASWAIEQKRRWGAEREKVIIEDWWENIEIIS